MNVSITGDVAMLDRKTRNKTQDLPQRMFQRLSRQIADIDLSIRHIARTGSTLCEVTVRTYDRMQVVSRDRDQDASAAIQRTLERAKVQVGQSIKRARRRSVAALVPALVPPVALND
jgi:hypothetical protein